MRKYLQVIGVLIGLGIAAQRAESQDAAYWRAKADEYRSWEQKDRQAADYHAKEGNLATSSTCALNAEKWKQAAVDADRQAEKADQEERDRSSKKDGTNQKTQSTRSETVQQSGEERAVGQDDDAQKIAGLEKGLKSPNAKVRKQSAIALGEIGPKAERARPALQKALTDPDDGVQAAAADALERIGAAALKKGQPDQKRAKPKRFDSGELVALLQTDPKKIAKGTEIEIAGTVSSLRKEDGGFFFLYNLYDCDPEAPFVFTMVSCYVHPKSAAILKDMREGQQIVIRGTLDSISVRTREEYNREYEAAKNKTNLDRALISSPQWAVNIAVSEVIAK